MSSSMFDPSKLISGRQSALSVTDEEVARKRAEEAEKQFEDEVTLYKEEVLGDPKKRVPRPFIRKGPSWDPTEGDVGRLQKFADDASEYMAHQEACMDRMYRHNVKLMRGIALQAQSLNRTVIDAAGMAQKAWDTSQQVIEVYGARQYALRQHLEDTQAVLKALVTAVEGYGVFESVEGLDVAKSAAKTLEEMDPSSAAPAHEGELSTDFEDALKRLVARAKAQAEALGGKAMGGHEGARAMTADYLRTHGQQLAQQAQKPSSFTSRLIKARR